MSQLLEALTQSCRKHLHGLQKGLGHHGLLRRFFDSLITPLTLRMGTGSNLGATSAATTETRASLLFFSVFPR